MSVERLEFWDMLLRGAEVNPELLRSLASKAGRDAEEEEKASWVLLLAAAELMSTESLAGRRNLLAYLRYRFSQTAQPFRPKDFDPRRLEGVGLERIVGLKLTWEEALLSVGRVIRSTKDIDYSALKRTEAKLKERSRQWWAELFGQPPKVLEGGEEND